MPKLVNKVEFGSQTIMDVTDATASADDIVEGKSAYIGDGSKAAGTLGSKQASSGGTDLSLVTTGEKYEWNNKSVKALWVNMGTINSLPVTKSATGVSSDMVCAQAELGTPSAQTSDWTVTTASGSVTISGSISGSTTLKILLVQETDVTAT